MLHALWKCLKFILILVIAVEILSFAAMTLHNYILYGNVYSHVPVRYDPDTLFLMTDSNPPSDFNSVSTNPKLNRTIWMFGGSTVRCNAHWNQNKTLPALLSKFLNEKAKPYHFNVVNFGENGFNSVLESKYVQKTFAEKRDPPDVVIFYDGANDCFQYVEYRQPVGHVGYRRLKAFIESYRMGWLGLFKPINAAIHASYTNEFIDRIYMLRDPVRPNSPNLEKMAELAAGRYDHIAKMAHCYGAEFALIWQPMLWVEDCKADEQVQLAERTTFINTDKLPELKESLKTTYKKLELALWDKPYFVSLRNALCKRNTALFEPDGIHLTTRGNELMAGNIGELLINRFPERLLPQASSDQP